MYSKPPSLLGMGLLLVLVSSARAHPVPKGSHDRTVTVRLTPEAVIVEYRLEVDLHTMIFEDLREVTKEDEWSKLSEPKEFIETFTRLFGPHLARGLRGRLDNENLTFVCTEHKHELLDHLRCDFVFRAAWKPRADPPQQFEFREANFLTSQGLFKPGKVDLTLVVAPGIRRLRSTDPVEEGLTAEQRARLVTARIGLGDGDEEPEPIQKPPPSDEKPRVGRGSDSELVRLFLGSKHGPVLLLLLSAFLGGVHALTPGHGKTLVAAYLVGERGTVRHAIVLGLVTTLTHTGAVLLLALVLRMMFPGDVPPEERDSIHQTLSLVAGLLIAGLGFWLLLRRLSGKADHIHLGGSGHHVHSHGGHVHSHGGHVHSHGGDDHDHSHPVKGGWRGLVLLGVTGGIVPCWDAVALLLAAVGTSLFWWALPMLLAFSAGLAAVLVAIGILVVRTKWLAGQRWEQSRVFRALPLISAVLVTCLGLWLCYQAVG